MREEPLEYDLAESQGIDEPRATPRWSRLPIAIGVAALAAQQQHTGRAPEAA
jgi:hypothetical protein